MRKLLLTPSQSSYAVDFGEESLRAKLSGGPSRTRLDFVGAVAVVNVSWNLPPISFDYLQAFYRTASKRASEPFLIDLIIDQSPLTEYTAKFIPGTYRLGGVKGLQTTVSAQLEARPLAINEAFDVSLMDIYEVYGEESWAALNILEQLVNINFPSSIPAP